MRRIFLFMAIFCAYPVLGVTTKDEELARHMETGGVGDSVLRFHPYVETEYQHDDNLNYVEEGAKADHIGILRPGFSIVWSNQETTYLSLQYQLEVEEFLRDTGLDTLNHRLGAKADWNWDPFYLFVRESYLDTNDRSYTTLTQLIQRRDDRQNVTTGWQRNELTLELQGEHFNRRFEESLSSLDFSTYGLAPSASWDWTESQRMLADAGWDRDYYPNDAARTGHSLRSRLGWEFHPTDEFMTRVLGGYATRHFDGSLLNDFDGWIGEWTFNVTRFFDRGRLQGGARTGAQESITDAASGYYREHLFHASLAYDVTSKIVPSATVSWARQIYGNTQTSPVFTGQRNDDVTTAGFQVKYAVSDQLSVVPAYAFQHRASNFPLQNFNDNTISLTCRYAL